MTQVRKYIGIFLNITVPIAATVLLWLLVPKLLGFFMPFLIGLLIALAAAPLVRFLERKVRLMRHITSMMIIIGALAFIIFLIWLAGSMLVRELIQLIGDAPRLYQEIEAELLHTLQRFEKLVAVMPIGIQKGIAGSFQGIENALTEAAAALYSPTVEAAGNLAKKIPDIMVYAIVTLMSAYFFLSDFDYLKEFCRCRMPKFVLNSVKFLRNESKKIVGGYFLAQLRIMFVVAVILAIGLMIMDVSYGGLIALLISMLDMLPIFGTGTVLIPWAIIKVINGSYGMAAWLIALYGITQLVRQLIQPKLLGDSMGMKPLPTLFLLYVGYRLRGFTGMILAVPVGMIFLEAVRIGVYDNTVKGIETLCQTAVRLMQQSAKEKDGQQ